MTSKLQTHSVDNNRSNVLMSEGSENKNSEAAHCQIIICHPLKGHLSTDTMRLANCVSSVVCEMLNMIR